MVYKKFKKKQQDVYIYLNCDKTDSIIFILFKSFDTTPNELQKKIDHANIQFNSNFGGIIPGIKYYYYHHKSIEMHFISSILKCFYNFIQYMLHFVSATCI